MTICTFLLKSALKKLVVNDGRWRIGVLPAGLVLAGRYEGETRQVEAALTNHRRRPKAKKLPRVANDDRC